jgi:hypothetical protein
VRGGYHLAHQRPSTSAMGIGEITLSPATVETPRPPLARREAPIWRRLQTIDGGQLLGVTLGVRPASAYGIASAQSRITTRIAKSCLRMARDSMKDAAALQAVKLS